MKNKYRVYTYGGLVDIEELTPEQFEAYKKNPIVAKIDKL